MSFCNTVMSILKTASMYDLLDSFKTEMDNESRLKLVLKNAEKFEPFDSGLKGKNNEESIKLRKMADRLVIKQKDRNAVLLESNELYTKSIAYAEPHSSALALGYANRSSVMFHLYRMEECVRDIDRALSESSYPDHLRPNLLRRKAKCLKKLGDNEGAKKVCEESRCLLENLSLGDDVKEKLESKINHVNEVTENSKLQDIDNEVPSFVPNPRIPSASEAVELAYDEKFGRHLVTTRHVNVGEVLFIEKPYVLYVEIPYIYKYCNHCLNIFWDGIPCEHCVHTVYCSEKCKETAWKQYHDLECQLKEYLINLKTSDKVLISLKLTLLALKEYGSLEQLKKQLDNVAKCTDCLVDSYSPDGIYHSENYKTIYNLLTHEKDQDSFEKVLSMSTAALILLFFNANTNLFSESDKSTLALCKNANALFFGRLFFHNYWIIHVNCHEFNQVNLDNYLKFGDILGSLTSLLNHSCDPNVSRCPIFKDGVASHMIYALRPISEGSQIFDDYGCFFIQTPKSERKKFISEFHFKCDCQACVESWPTLDGLTSIFDIIIDKEKKLHVARTMVHSEKWRKIIHDVEPNSNENPIVVLNDLTRFINLLSEMTKKPSKEFYLTVESFKLAILKYYGFKFSL